MSCTAILITGSAAPESDHRSPGTRTAAATMLGITQPNVSALANYKLKGFSVERLMTFLTTLDRDIEIVMSNKPGRARPGVAPARIDDRVE